nr:MAG TPA: hypothetical protein [Caudoviricetes sp.]
MKPLPVAIPPWCTTSLQLALAVSALGRGVDYINDSRPQPGLSVVEAFLSLDTWGILFTVLGLLMLVGTVARSFSMLIVSNIAVAALFAGLGAGILLDASHRPEFMGFRTGWGLIWGAAAAHAILAVSLMLAARMRR